LQVAVKLFISHQLFHLSIVFISEHDDMKRQKQSTKQLKPKGDDPMKVKTNVKAGTKRFY
jgi:hypothetical protein